MIYPDPLSRLDILLYFIPLTIYWIPFFQLRFNFASVSSWKRWTLFGILFVPFIGVFLLAIMAFKQSNIRGKDDRDYKEAYSGYKNGKKEASKNDEQFETSNNEDESSSSDSNTKGSGTDNKDLQDKSELENDLEDENLVKIKLRNLSNISTASIEGKSSSYNYALSPDSKYILCYKDGHRDSTGREEKWVKGEVMLLQVVDTESEDILTAKKIVRFDFERPLNADVNDRGEWIVVNSKQNVGENSVKWFNKGNLKEESEFEINIMGSGISNEGISILVTAPAYSTIYCYQDGIREWEKEISNSLPFNITNIEFIPEDEEIKLESSAENKSFRMSYTGEIINNSVIKDNSPKNNYKETLPEDRGSFPKKSYQSNLKFSKEEKEAIRDKFNEHEEIIRKEEKLDYVGTKNSSYKSSFLVRRNDNTLPLEKSVKQYYENEGWWVSRSLEEKENLVVNIFSDDSSVSIPNGENIADKVYSFLKTHSRGLPDLFGYNPSENKFYFIEVKSQNDTLSLVQKKWYNKFLELKPDIEYIVHKVNSKSIRPQTLEKVSLKGISYRDIPLSYFNNISKNETVELVPEPENQHDPLAVKVSHNGKFIGYLPENLDYKKKVIEAIKEEDYSAEITHFHRASSKRKYGVFMKIDFLKSN